MTMRNVPDVRLIAEKRREREEAEERAAAQQRAASMPDRTTSGPPADVAEANRLRWVARYAQMGWHPGRIRQALEQHLPANQWVDDATVERDLKRLLAIYRKEALDDTEAVFAKLAARLDSVAQTAYEEYHSSLAPRRVRTPDGEMTLPPASQSERTAMLNTVIRATAAQTVLFFGQRGSGVTLNVDARSQSITLSKEAADSIGLREQVAEMRRLLAEDDRAQPRRRALPRPRATEEREIIEADVQSELEDVVAGQGVRGSFTEQWEEDD